MPAADTSPVILAARRTPIGRFFGGLTRVPSPQLGAYAIEAALADLPGGASAVADQIDECLMGCVLQAGLGQNPARQAGLKAGLPDTLSAQTVNKVCGSGLQAVMSAAQSIKAGDNQLVVAGGMENMTAAPHFAQIRSGVKFGPVQQEDHMQFDGLRCPFECWGMTSAADWISTEFDISREEQDRFSAQSHQRAAAATESCFFSNEIVTLSPEQCLDKRGSGVEKDEGIRADSSPEGLAKLRTVPGHETITAGNASQISDGGAAVVVASQAKAESLGAEPMARIVAYHTSGVNPKAIFTAPALAIPAMLEKAGRKLSEIDLFELNEAFASQVLHNLREVGIPEDRLNICGGGIALGHPIGASGARVLTTLIHQMKRTDSKRGVAALCLGGGNAVAMLIERE